MARFLGILSHLGCLYDDVIDGFPTNGYVTENGADYYVTEDGLDFYVQES